MHPSRHPLFLIFCASSTWTSVATSTMITSTSTHSSQSTKSPSVTAAVQLTQVIRWNQADACAQSCADGATSSFYSSLSCSNGNPATCLCPSVDSIAGSARSCGLASCPLSATTVDKSPDYIEAKMIIYDYCSSNGLYTTALAAVVTTPSMTTNTGHSSIEASRTETFLTFSNITYSNAPSSNTSSEPCCTSHTIPTSGMPESNWMKFGWRLTTALVCAFIVLSCGIWIYRVFKRRKARRDTEMGVMRSGSFIQRRAKFNSKYYTSYEIWQDDLPHQRFNMLLDTGCNGSNWISPNIFEKLGAKATDLDEPTFFSDFNNNKIPAHRKTRLNFQRLGVPEAKIHSAEFLIADHNTLFEVMLGANDIREFDLLSSPSDLFRPVFPLIAGEPSTDDPTLEATKNSKKMEAEKYERGRMKREKKLEQQKKKKREQEQLTKK